MSTKTRLSALHTKSIPRFTLQQLLDLGYVRTVEVPDDGTGFQTVFVMPDGRSTAEGKSVGYSVLGASKLLKVSRQRIHQLIKVGVLEGYELLDDAKCSAGLFITPASLSAFKTSSRKPGPKPRTTPGRSKT